MRLKSAIDGLVNFDLAGGLSTAAKRRLESVRSNSLRLILILYCVIAAVIAISLYLMVTMASSPQGYAGLVGATGISVGGCVEMLRRVWKDFVASSLILVLIGEATEAEVNKLLARLMRAYSTGAF